MGFRETLAALRAAWWIVVIALLTGAGSGIGVAALLPEEFSVDTQLFVSTSQSDSNGTLLQAGQFSQERVASYAALIEGSEVADQVREQLNLPLTIEEVQSKIQASSSANTVLIDVTVTDTSADRAVEIASAIGRIFSGLVSELETPTDSGESPVRVTVTEEPRLPRSSSFPSFVVFGATGAILLGALSVGVLLIRRLLDQTVKTAEDVESITQLPVVGVIMEDSSLATEHVMERNSVSRTAEGYRQLRTNLQFLNVDEPPKVLMVSSAVPSEGKTTLAVNLAISLAEAGRSVTIVEADLRRPRVTRYMGMVGGVGLTNILTGSAGLDDVIQPYGDGALSVLAAGPTPPNPGELLSSSQMFALIDELRAQSDFVLLDAPPLLPVADSSGLAVLVDGVVLSMRYGVTTKNQLAQTKLTLDRVGAKALGVVLNIVPPRAEVTSAYGYGYNYGYDPDPAAPVTS